MSVKKTASKSANNPESMDSPEPMNNHKSAGLVFSSRIGNICLIAEDGKLISLRFIGDFPKEGLFCGSDEASVGCCKAAELQINEYLEGKRRFFDFPAELRATDFTKRVLGEVSLIPYGERAPYGFIAERLGIRSPRAVGQALKRNPLPLVIPCHRVVSSAGVGGFTTERGKESSLSVKRFLLGLESSVRLSSGTDVCPKE